LKIILFANTDWYLYNYRLTLAETLKQQGHTIILVAPEGAFSSRIRQLGFDLRTIHLSRRGIYPLEELNAIRELFRIFKQEKPDIIHNFTIKCVLYGSLAARITGVKGVVNAITGLGYVFTRNNLFTQIARPIVRGLYRWLLKGTAVIFQNQADMDYFFSRKLIGKKQGILIPSSGVDTNLFTPAPAKIEQGLVVLSARMLWDKGVAEFVEAARILHQSGVKALFALVGDIDQGNPSSIPIDQLHAWEKEGVVVWWGWQDNMVDVYQRAQVVCLPSSYGEGLSKSLIEAAACGCPLVTTDIPGCREVVQEGKNGFLVPLGDAASLAKAIRKILKMKAHDLSAMRQASRKLAINEYALEKIISKTIIVYNQLDI